MAKPKEKFVRRVAGASKFRLPERAVRTVEENPLREILREAKAQEEARFLPATTVVAPQSQGPTAEQQPRRVQTRKPNVPAVAQAVKKPLAINPLSSPLPVITKLEESPADFAGFLSKWSTILHSGQIKFCRTLYELTYANGKEEFFTSMPKLAAAAGLKERQCYNIVKQLELLGILARPHIYNTATKKGTVFRLILTPEPSGKIA